MHRIASMVSYLEMSFLKDFSTFPAAGERRILWSPDVQKKIVCSRLKDCRLTDISLLFPPTNPVGITKACMLPFSVKDPQKPAS